VKEGILVIIIELLRPDPPKTRKIDHAKRDPGREEVLKED